MEGFTLLLNFLQDLQIYLCFSKILPVPVTVFVTVLLLSRPACRPGLRRRAVQYDSTCPVCEVLQNDFWIN